MEKLTYDILERGGEGGRCMERVTWRLILLYVK